MKFTIMKGHPDTQKVTYFRCTFIIVNFIIVKNTCVIGDFDQFMNKYNTCARTRPYGDQFLTSRFYMNEHTKPLVNANKIRF